MLKYTTDNNMKSQHTKTNENSCIGKLYIYNKGFVEPQSKSSA